MLTHTVYQVVNGVLHPFNNIGAFVARGYEWSDVKRYPAYSKEAHPGAEFGSEIFEQKLFFASS